VIVFIDFDETLFEHTRFANFLEEKLATTDRSYSFLRTLDDFHQVKGDNLRLYDHKSHIFSTFGRSWEFVSGEVTKYINQDVADFCYEDSHEFLDRVVSSGHDVRILTYGDADYQRFKIATCSKLRTLNIPIHVVNEPKRCFIDREFGHSTGFLVDDKYPQNLPVAWTHIHIDRTQGSDALRCKDVYSIREEGVIRVRQLALALDSIMSYQK
jgi:hypothetical protein